MIGAEAMAATVEAAELAVAAGFRTLKLKAGKADTTATLVERVGAVREAVGDDIDLRLDVNGTWDLEDPARACARWPGSRCSTWSSRSPGRWPRRRRCAPRRRRDRGR